MDFRGNLQLAGRELDANMFYICVLHSLFDAKCFRLGLAGS